MKNLIATKRMRYGTRHLQVGDRFEARDNDAKLLIRMKRAVEPVRAPVEVPPMPTKVEAKLAELAPVVEAPVAPVVAAVAEAQESVKPWEAAAPVAPLTLLSPLDQMRQRYQKETGKKADARWGIARIEQALSDGI